jgi:hypothetical protein
MNPDRLRAERRALDRWPLFLAVLGLVLAVAWLLPRRSREVVLADGAQRWSRESAPPRRTIVWRPAERLPAAPEDLAAADSLVRPQLAEGGRAIYFTRQRPGGDADIYRSEFDGERWLPAEPVAAINSPGGDYGPFISADGRTLLLSSDRAGGFGGYDLYVARRADGGWSEPENLGPLVNSPAHEYDPALSPDGRRLFFSSNRTPRMEARLAEAAAAGGAASPWKATLRAEVALEHFDIYAADRADAEADWSPAVNLRAVNLPDTNEGEPTLSADGAFLYFVSDRSNPHGPAGNYDIYRVRFLSGGVSAIENLGSGVNTAANEHDPGLSADGFRIVFSSDRTAAAPEQYALYASLAAETFDEAVWSTSHLEAIGRHWWWLMLLALLLGLIAALAWYLRTLSRRRAPVPVFFLVALLLHVLMISGAFLVPIEGVTLAERIRQKIEQIVATDVVLESNPIDASAPQQAFEAVAEPLQAVETVAVTATPRQAVADPALPRPQVQPTDVQLSTAFNREEITERVSDATPVVVQSVADPQLDRRESLTERMLAEAAVAIEAVPAARETPAEQAAPQENVVAERAASEPRVEVNPVSVPVSEPVTQPKLAAEAVAAATPAATLVPATRQAAELPERAARAEAVAADSPAVETLEVPRGSQQAVAESAPAPAAVELARQATEQRPDVPAAVPVPVATRQVPVRPVADAGGRAPDTAPAPPTAIAAVTPSSLPRQERAGSVPEAASETIATDAPSQRPAAEAGEVALAESVEVELARDPGGARVEIAARQVSAPVAAPASVLQPVPEARPIPAPAAAAAPPRPAAAAALARRSSTAAPEVAGGAAPIAAAELAAPQAAAALTPSQLAAAEVKVARAAPAAAVATGGMPVRINGDRAGPRLASLDATAVGSRLEVSAATPSGQIGASLARRRSAPTALLYAQDEIGLQQMLRKRVLDERSKQELIEAFGGRPETLEAIRRGLHWLAVVQHPDGRWKLQEFPDGPAGEKYTGQGRHDTDTGATGLALLPFLGDGHTPISGRYQEVVSRGLRWLIENQKPDGCLTATGPNQATMYAHGIATIALCEAYGMTKETWLQEPAQRAIDFIVASQHDGGGWRYQPKEPGDTSVVGWQVMALKSGQMAGLNVPGATLEKAQAFLQACRIGAQFCYHPGSGPGRPGLTGVGLLCMQYLGWKRDSAEVVATVDYVTQNLPAPGKFDSYYLYYGTQSVFHVQGEAWQKWNAAMSDTVLSTQVKDGPHAGTWDPQDEFEQHGGQIYSTALRLLVLEVYFRHLPLYQVLQ